MTCIYSTCPNAGAQADSPETATCEPCRNRWEAEHAPGTAVDEAIEHLRAARVAVQRAPQLPTRALTLSAIAEAVRYLERAR